MAKRQFSTHAANPETIDALHDHIPEWMKSSLDSWILKQLSDASYKPLGLMPDLDLLHRLERLLRVDLISNAKGREAMQVIFYKMNQNSDIKLDVVDGILQLTGTSYSGTGSLEDILLQSGSKWRVAQDESGNYSLEERVDATTTTAMEDIVGSGGDVARYITKAWNEAFGRSPSPSVSYSNAIKAVEAASWQVVIPDNNRATLGVIIKALRDKPENFQVQITEKVSGQGIEAIRNQMSLIWDGQTDRHGTANPVEPSQEAAEEALFIALSLCQQFVRGLISHA
ncbi:MAG TPA: hypothetical protein VFZ58_04565 [Candidatus Saccharimonadales bacterium]